MAHQLSLCAAAQPAPDTLLQSAARLKGWHSGEGVLRCIRWACTIAFSCCRAGMKDLENVRCLIRQACVDAFEKLYNEKAVRSWTEKVQDDIFSASLQLMDLATAKLEQVSQC